MGIESFEIGRAAAFGEIVHMQQHVPLSSGGHFHQSPGERRILSQMVVVNPPECPIVIAGLQTLGQSVGVGQVRVIDIADFLQDIQLEFVSHRMVESVPDTVHDFFGSFGFTGHQADFLEIGPQVQKGPGGQNHNVRDASGLEMVVEQGDFHYFESSFKSPQCRVNTAFS